MAVVFAYYALSTRCDCPAVNFHSFFTVIYNVFVHIRVYTHVYQSYMAVVVFLLVFVYMAVGVACACQIVQAGLGCPAFCYHFFLIRTCL